MQVLVRPELPTASVGSSQATTAAVDNSAPLATRPQSTYKSGKVVQTSGATSVLQARAFAALAVSQLFAKRLDANRPSGPAIGKDPGQRFTGDTIRFAQRCQLGELRRSEVTQMDQVIPLIFCGGQVPGAGF